MKSVTQISTVGQKSMLKACASAFQREAPVLTKQPDHLWKKEINHE